SCDDSIREAIEAPPQPSLVCRLRLCLPGLSRDADWRIFCSLTKTFILLVLLRRGEPRLYGEYFCLNAGPATKFACDGFSPIQRRDGWLISPHPRFPIQYR